MYAHLHFIRSFTRLDAGNDKHGRPIHRGEVENIKVAYVIGTIIYRQAALLVLFVFRTLNFINQMKSTVFFLFFVFNMDMFKNGLLILVLSFLIIFYQLSINPFFHNYISKMSKELELD